MTTSNHEERRRLEAELAKHKAHAATALRAAKVALSQSSEWHDAMSAYHHHLSRVVQINRELDRPSPQADNLVDVSARRN